MNPPIDKSALKSLYELQNDSDPTLVKDLIEMFLRLAPERIASMRSALAAQDPLALSRLAHDLKSSGANLGASTLSTLAGELEKEGRARSLQNAPANLARLEAEFDRVREALLAEIARGDAPVQGT